MRSGLILVSLLASTMLSTAAFAQTQPAPATAPAAATMKHSGEWRASKLIGLDIYNQQNEKIGDVNEILMDASGKAVGYVIGVGGFLGMGEHDVLVKPDELKFVNEPIRTSAAPNTGTTTGTAARTDRPAARDARAATEKWWPDHAVMNASKDELKGRPQFKYSNYN